MITSAPNPSQPVRILAVGLHAQDLAPFENQLVNCNLNYLADDTKKLMDPHPSGPSIILCGDGSGRVSKQELAQLLRAVYPKRTIFLISKDKVEYDRDLLIQNGFTDAFIMPMDAHVFKQSLADAVSLVTAGRVPSFHPVKLLDIQPGTILDFDLHLYLPANDRYLTYSRSGEEFEARRAERLTSHQMGTVYVEASQLNRFFQYVAARINPREITQKKERMQSEVRNLMSELLSFAHEHTAERGRTLTQKLMTIANEYVLGSKQTDWYLPLLNWIGEKHGTYNHSANVALYATLLATQLGMDQIKDIVIAGLLHDLGLVNIPADTLAKEEFDWAPEERSLYERHPIFSMQLVTTRHLKISALSKALIEQHHERVDGSGYPKHLKAKALDEESQLLGLVDFLDYQIGIKEGHTQTTPALILRDIEAGTLAKGQFDPELIRKILELLPKI